MCHMRLSPKLSQTDVWLLGDSNRNPGFSIQNLPSDSRSEVRFCHLFLVFSVRHFAHCDRNLELGLVNAALGIVIGLCVIWLKFRMITDRKIPVERHVSKLEEEVELNSDARGRCFEFNFRSILRHRSRYRYNYNCNYNSAADRQTSLKFCTTTDMKVPPVCLTPTEAPGPTPHPALLPLYTNALPDLSPFG